MPWNPNIPAATDIVAISQGQLQANFQALATVVNPTMGVGLHLFPNNALPPTAGVTAIEISSATSNGNPQLFITRPAAIGTLPQQYTFTDCLNAANGWTRLPSGLLFQWGSLTFVGDNGGTVNFAIPFPTACYSVTFSALTTSPPNTIQNVGSLFITGIVAASFTYKWNSGAGRDNGLYYMAIGI